VIQILCSQIPNLKNKLAYQYKPFLNYGGYVEDVERCKDDEEGEEEVVVKDGEGGGFILGNLESKCRNELNLNVH
jgi:hypothetical protein